MPASLALARVEPLATLPFPTVLCIMDGVGWGGRDDGDAVSLARTPTLDRLMNTCPWRLLMAHGPAVGLPAWDDMGNSEVGHNAMGAGRVFDQGSKLVTAAIESERIFAGAAWKEAVTRPTLHLLGLLSDGNVHSHVKHLHALIARAAADGVRRLRVHALTDGRDVPERSAPTWIAPLEALLAEHRAHGRDFHIASGGGRMGITMDRYEADWGMVARGWACHVHGEGRPFPSASAAIESLYAADAKITDQFLPAFVVVGDDGAPVGRVQDRDAVILFNFRGDRALEISRAFERRDLPAGFRLAGADGRPAPAEVFFAGMMEYDGDTHLPAAYLVEPPAIDRTVADHLAAARVRSFAVSETQKFGHVTYFFNGNRSEPVDPDLEKWEKIESDPGDFDKAPVMKAVQITAAAVEAIASGRYRHIRLNFPNGDMVGHTGSLEAAVAAVEAVDAGLARPEAAVIAAGGVMIVTADHGNADQMFEVDKKTGGYARGKDGARKVRTAHSLNPVPCILLDPRGRFQLNKALGPEAGLGNLGAALLWMVGLVPPVDYLPGVVVPR
ncbi:MAG: 2,3-bisphosphoglycerate-independent phosphoglycerate mutase [Pseudomonadota bacterium]